MNPRILRMAVMAAALCVAPLAAHADSTCATVTVLDGSSTVTDGVCIALSAISGAPGSTVDVMATFTNTGPDVLNLDSDNLSTSDPLTPIDEFLMNAPFTINGGDSSTFEPFALSIAPGTAPGVYGTDGSDVFSFFGDFNGVPIEDDLSFTADVTGPAIVTPEPGSMLLLATGLAGLGVFKRRKDH